MKRADLLSDITVSVFAFISFPGGQETLLGIQENSEERDSEPLSPFHSCHVQSRCTVNPSTFAVGQ